MAREICVWHTAEYSGLIGSFKGHFCIPRRLLNQLLSESDEDEHLDLHPHEPSCSNCLRRRGRKLIAVFVYVATLLKGNIVRFGLLTNY